MALSERMGVATILLFAAGGVCADAATAGERQQSRVDNSPVTQAAAAATGRIVGAVTDTAGVPLDGAMVSALGPSGAELALADADGSFLLRALAPGAYLVQAHLQGFAASRRELIEVTASTPTVHAITLSRVGQVAEPIAASVGLPRPSEAGAQSESESEQDETDAAMLGGEPAGASSGPHDHSEKAWRLRRARRSVLKDAQALAGSETLVPDGESSGASIAMLSRQLGSPATFASGLLELPLTGEVNLLTRGTLFDSAADILTGEERSASIANLSVGAPLWRGGWSAQGAMTTGDVMSWAASGAYLADVDTSHRLGLDVSYGRQRYQGGNPAALTLPSESRFAASFGASDIWTVSPQLTVDYGGRYAKYGYIEEQGLFSPRIGVTVTPVTGFRVRVSGAQETVAPGAEEFMPPPDTGFWLPPERTFAAFVPERGLHPERTRHVDAQVEYDLTDQYVVGVRRFYQDVSDQMATLFGAGELGNAPIGHYDLARAGSLTSRGWVLMLRRQLGDRFSGSVDYAIAETDWRQIGADAVPGARRPATERFHDMSGAFEAEIPESATRVFVRCRVSTAFVRVDSDDPSGLDARFDVQVNQALPFSPIEGSRWEVLVSVRSLFFDPHETASMFDELLVERPPMQVVSGLVVHF
jgi:hypothetical protein